MCIDRATMMISANSSLSKFLRNRGMTCSDAQLFDVVRWFAVLEIFVPRDLIGIGPVEQLPDAAALPQDVLAELSRLNLVCQCHLCVIIACIM